MNKDVKDVVVRIGLLAIVLLFTLYGFVIKQPCDIDEQYLWCRLHPMSILQVVGVIGFYLGAFLLSGIWQKWFTLYDEVNSTRWNLTFFGAIALSIVLIWIG